MNVEGICRCVFLDKDVQACYIAFSSDIVNCGYAGQVKTCGVPADGRYYF